MRKLLSRGLYQNHRFYFPCNSMIKNKQNKNDLILIVAVLAVALIALSLFLLLRRGGSDVVLTVDGEEIGRYSLLEDRTVEIPSHNGGSNTVVIANGAASVSDASCPDQICVSHRKISMDGEVIVCLPNRLVVSIEAE